jgi:hypothetical protein
MTGQGEYRLSTADLRGAISGRLYCRTQKILFGNSVSGLSVVVIWTNAFALFRRLKDSRGLLPYKTEILKPGSQDGILTICTYARRLLVL